MARPTKIGLNYFPIDCDLLNDEKMIAVKVNCGAKGIAVTVALLCVIYRQGYCALWNDATALKIANDLPGVSPDSVEKVVEILVKYDFFDKGLFCAENILTSAAIQRRWLAGKKYRVNVSQLPHWLVLDSKTPIMDSKTPVLGVDNPIKKSKIKISTPNVVDIKRPPPPPSSATTVEQEIEILKADDIWLDNLQVMLSMAKPDIIPRLSDFAVACRANGRDRHDSINDCKSHFVNWINKKAYVSTLSDRSDNARRNRCDKNRGQFSPPACGLIES